MTLKRYAASPRSAPGAGGGQVRALNSMAVETPSRWRKTNGDTVMSDDEIARAKDIVRVIAAAHVGGDNVMADAQTRALLETVVGDANMVHAVARHFAALTTVLAQWLAHELGTPSRASVAEMIEDVLADLVVSDGLEYRTEPPDQPA